MKNKFSWVAAIFVSMLLLATTSCKNSSQIIFEDTSNNGLTKDGLSALTVQIGEVSRNITAENWTDAKKSTLLYKITAQTTPAGATVTLGDENTPNIFTWDEISKGDAVMYLDPKEWTLTLTAYQPESPKRFKAKDVTNAKPVLEAKGVTANLTTGAQDITFNLKTVTVTEAVGNVDLQLKFFNEADIALKNVVFRILDGKTDILAKASVDNGEPKTKYTAEELSVIGDRGLSSALLQGKVKAGKYQLQVIFSKANGKVINVYEEPITIEGNNDTRAVIEIPENTFGRVPTQPSVLTSSVSWDPTEKTGVIEIDLGNGKKVFGQELAANGTSEPTGIHKFYKVTFNWNDNSYNEEEFELKLTTSNPASGTITINKAGAKGSAACIKIAGTNGAETSVTWVKGDLHAGSTSLTLQLPMSTKITKAEISAKNSIVNAPEDIAPLAVEKKIGMFFVTYRLTTPELKDKTSKICYGADAEQATKAPYYVTAYEISDAMKLTDLINAGPAFPYVKLDGNYKFSCWKQATENQYDVSPTLKTLTDGTLQAGEDIVVCPAWLIPTSFIVNFPDHTKEKSLTVDTTNPKNTVITPDANGKIIVTAPTGSPIAGTYDNYNFAVFYTNGGTSTTTTTTVDPSTTPAIPETLEKEIESKDFGKYGIVPSGNTLTWTTKGVQGGDYRIVVSYDYTPESGTVDDKINIKGNLYVKING